MIEDCILLEGMIFFGRHGTLPAEQELGQQFVVDLALYCDLRPAGRSDDLDKTVDYSRVHQQVKEIVEGAPCGLIEAVAERIAEDVLDQHPMVEAVRVKVSKPQVHLEGTVLAGSAVQITRRRSGFQ
jgi:dihydroneopterin aldolase